MRIKMTFGQEIDHGRLPEEGALGVDGTGAAGGFGVGDCTLRGTCDVLCDRHVPGMM